MRDDKGKLPHGRHKPALGAAIGVLLLRRLQLDNPYPTGGGANVPGFDALTFGRAQLFSLSDAKSFGVSTVNQFHASFMRSSNNVGKPKGGLGPSYPSQGFATDEARRSHALIRPSPALKMFVLILLCLACRSPI